MLALYGITMNGCFKSLRSYGAFKLLLKNENLCKTLEAGGPVCPTDMLHSLLQDCLQYNDLTVGRQVQHFIIYSGLESSPSLASYLIRWFAVRGSSSEAYQVFQRLPVKNVYAWTALITAYTKSGQCLKAIKLYNDMQKACVKPDGHSFVALLKACSSIAATPQGRLIHAHIIEIGLEANLFIGNTLVDMYAKGGFMEESTRLFGGLQNKDITTWNAMIAGFFHCGYVPNALELFEQLQKKVVLKPNIVTWNAMIAGCVQYGFHEAAFELFLTMQQQGVLPDKLTWNSLIFGHIQHDCGWAAMQLFRQMQIEGVEPDMVTFMCVFKTCASLSSLNFARFLHSQLIETSIYTSVMIGSSLVDMYSKCGDLQAAIQVFNHQSTNRDMVSWNTIIAAHIHHACCQNSFKLFQQMQHESVIPHQVTFVLMLKACCGGGYLQEGRLLHSYSIESSYDYDVFVGTALVDLYMKCGCLLDARMVFDKLPRRGLFTWSALVAGYAWHGYAEESAWLLQQMRQDGVKPTVITWNGLIRGCAYNGLCTEALVNFEQMLLDDIEPNETTLVGVLSACLDVKDLKQGELMYSYIVEGGWESGCNAGSVLISMYAYSDCLQASLWIFHGLSKQEINVWSTMIEALAQFQYYEDAIQVFQNMQQEGLMPNQVLFTSILKACVGTKALFQSKLMHVLALELGFESDKPVGHSLINVYAKCGSLRDAWKVFHRVLNRDEVTWSAMMEACAEHNDYKLALQCFQGMQFEDLDPNDVSFLSLLSACSRTGLIEEACSYFNFMRCAYSIAPTFTHYNSMADLLGRTGRLVEADDLLHTMPYEPNFIGYLCLLNHCKTYGNSYVGKDYFERTYHMTCRNSASYDFMSEIYAHTGSWKASIGLNKLKKCANAWKKPGGALLELDNKVEFFTVGGRNHPRTKEILSTLKKYSGQLEGEGYVPHSDIMLTDDDTSMANFAS